MEERHFRAALASSRCGLQPLGEIAAETMQIVLIDTFIVPEESRAALLQETRKIQGFLKTLPGFIEGFVYEKTAGESRVNIVTTAVWESDAAMEDAKKAAAAEFQKLGFNPQQLMRDLKVEAGRAVYRRSPY